MAEVEEYMGAYLSVVFVGARNVHVGRLRKDVHALSVAYPRTGFLHFSRKLECQKQCTENHDEGLRPSKVLLF